MAGQRMEFFLWLRCQDHFCGYSFPGNQSAKTWSWSLTFIYCWNVICIEVCFRSIKYEHGSRAQYSTKKRNIARYSKWLFLHTLGSLRNDKRPDRVDLVLGVLSAPRITHATGSNVLISHIGPKALERGSWTFDNAWNRGPTIRQLSAVTGGSVNMWMIWREILFWEQKLWHIYWASCL